MNIIMWNYVFLLEMHLEHEGLFKLMAKQNCYYKKYRYLITFPGKMNF